MLCTLNFLPPEEVINAFEALCGIIRNNFEDNTDDLLKIISEAPNLIHSGVMLLGEIHCFPLVDEICLTEPFDSITTPYPYRPLSPKLRLHY